MLIRTVMNFVATISLVAGSVSGQAILEVSNAQIGTGASATVMSPLNRVITVAIDNATLKEALATIGRQGQVDLTFSNALEVMTKRVTLKKEQVKVGEALNSVLSGTGLKTRVLPSGTVSVIQEQAGKAAAQGVVTGKITDLKTSKGISGVRVSTNTDSKWTVTDEEGVYRLTGLTIGQQIIVVRAVGYAKQSRPVSIGEGAVVTVDFKLEPSANVLDQVVVTGTVIASELKSVPNAITVVTAKQIEERGITKIDQLFRGDIPGLFAQNRGSGALLDEVTMFSRGATALSNNSVGVSTDSYLGVSVLTNSIKTYVDGIEMADSKYLSQIDPKSIERIEILTGPQASTIYGSNAINGVMQIFTKRGSTSHPQLSLNLLSGWVENNFSSTRTPQHDYSAQLNGVEGRFSYNAGGSWNYTGPWTPSKQLARTSGFGGVRVELPTAAGRVTTDMTLRRSLTQSLQRGDLEQLVTNFQQTGWYLTFGGAGLARPAARTLTGQTLGVTLSYAPASWWSHELGFGTDASDAETRVTGRGYRFESDTTLSLQQSHTDRRSLRYATTARLPVTSLAQVTVTAGADGWQSLTSSVSISPQTLTGTLGGTANVSRQPDHNTGGFIQTQVGLGDQLFLTYGLRAEWNKGYGADAQPNMAPRYGVAYTQELGPMTTKLRGSYGRSTRPPKPNLKVVQTIADLYGAGWSSASSSYLPYYGYNFDFRFANPDLAPEYQQGGEGGIELYLDTRASLVVTRYNQTVDGLIAQPIVDSVRTLVPCNSFSPNCDAHFIDADGYGYLRQSEYLNIGSIRNQGWELQGSVNTGPFTTRGTYSWTKSRVIGITPKYRTYTGFATQSQYQPGATFQYLPEHTWALGIMYSRVNSSVGLNVTGTGQAMNFNNEQLLRNLSSIVRIPYNRLRMRVPGYVNFNPSYALADVTASHRFASRIEGVLQVQNLADRYMNDSYAGFATMGRQMRVGVRMRTQ